MAFRDATDRLSTFVTSSGISHGGVNRFLSRPYGCTNACAEGLLFPLVATSAGGNFDTPYIDVFGRLTRLGSSPYRYRCDENPDSRNPCIFGWVRVVKIGVQKLARIRFRSLVVCSGFHRKRRMLSQGTVIF